MSVQAIIWDMGGVILQMVDETPRRQVAESLGIPLDTIYQVVFDSESARSAMRGEMSYADHWQWVCTELGLSAGDGADLHDYFWRADDIDRQLAAHIRRLRAHYKMGLLSNAWDDLNRRLVRWSLTDLFDVVVNSAEVHLAKPEPQIYHVTLERLGVSADQAVFIDDRLDNVEAARQVGMRGVVFQDRQQALEELDTILRDGNKI